MPGLEELEKRDDQERTAGAVAGAAPGTETGSDAGTGEPAPGAPPRRGPGRPRKSAGTGRRGRKPGRTRKSSSDGTKTRDAAVTETASVDTDTPPAVPVKALAGAIGGSVDLVTRIASKGSIAWSGEELEEWGDLWAPVLLPYLSVLGRGGPLAVALLGSANLIGRKFAGVSAPPAIASASSSDAPTPPAASEANSEPATAT